MKKISKLSLNKQALSKMQKSEMTEILGKGLYTTDLWLGSSASTSFTEVQSCCVGGQSCAYRTCYSC